MSRERILITVKSYPTLSKKYGQVVCTAGVREDGSWVRIYPVPLGQLHDPEQYGKFDWVECELKRYTRDPRPETFHPTDLKELVPVDHMGEDDNWRERRELLLGKCRVFSRMRDLIEGAKANEISLAVFKPAKVTEFINKPTPQMPPPLKLETLREQAKQGTLFTKNPWQEFDLIREPPYKFSYRFEDEEGRESTLRVLDWDVGKFYLKWFDDKSFRGSEERALVKTGREYFSKFTKTNLHFFLGTTERFAKTAPNPWVIIGVLPIPHETSP